MNQQRTVESRVLSILKDCPRARFDDMILIMHYYNRYATYLRAGELPLNDLAFNYKVYGLPCFETIRRARQRVQSLFPEYSRNAERFRAEVEKLDIPVTVITQADCIPDHYKNDINGKIIAINPAVLKPEYQRADRQLYLVTGGFGASANARGSAVFCRNLYDGKDTRYERMDVLGEVKPERMPDWAKEKAAAISRKHKTKGQER